MSNLNLNDTVTGVGGEITTHLDEYPEPETEEVTTMDVVDAISARTSELWNVRCAKCTRKFNMLTARSTREGNFICPHCNKEII